MSKRLKCVLAGLLLAALLAGGGYYALTCPLKFSPTLWQTFSRLRGRMLDDLLEEHHLRGMRRDEVLELLGEPGNSRHFPYTYQEQTYDVLQEAYPVQPRGVFYEDFLTLYYVRQNGDYVCVNYKQEAVDLF